ncbi:MAG: proteasome subunit beta, partial [Nanopusillaceae archaeon]
MAKDSGTTIVAIKFKEGIILASDRRTSLYPLLVYKKDTQKIYQVTDKILFAGAGVVGDIQYLLKVLKASLKLKELKSRSEPTAAEAANLLATIMNYHKFFPFFTEVIIAGKDEDGYKIYSIDEVGGLEEHKDFIATGSGMQYALAVLEVEYKPNLDKEKAKELAKRAVLSAIR